MNQGKFILGSKYKFRVFLILLADVIGIVAAFLGGAWVVNDFHWQSIPTDVMNELHYFIPMAVVSLLIIYYFLHLYHSVWRFASVSEGIHILASYLFALIVLGIENLLPFNGIPMSIFAVGYLLSGLWCVVVRFGYRFIRYIDQHRFALWNDKSGKPEVKVLLVGAGQAGREIIKDIRLGGHTEMTVCAIIDDNPEKLGRFLEGVKIVGNRDDIPSVVEEFDIDEIIVAIPSASSKTRAAILKICQTTDSKVQVVPEMFQFITGKLHVTQIRDVKITDLLGRDEIHVEMDEITRSIEGKTVMVTGGGGSIGSEICRQVAASNPKQLVIFDIYENNAYAIQQELRRKYPNLNLVTLIGSVRNVHRIESVIEKYRPEVIYHAAAHKHVPLMEDSPNEAIKNNVMGTYKTAMAAAKFGVQHFLLISTDKAVNPTNIMGASKRLCEMIIQMMSRKYPNTTFAAVRFGNVLGSNGSVIPLFEKQIAEGGPVTVTDKNIVRYFMTIPEAVSLVLQAAHYAKGGEIFVLDMGQPVKIYDMAVNMIKLSGLELGKDIQIEISGLRPGEKLYEELLMDEEGLQKTKNKLIYVGHPIKMDDDKFIDDLERLDKESKTDTPHIEKIVGEVVPTYTPRVD